MAKIASWDDCPRMYTNGYTQWRRFDRVLKYSYCPCQVFSTVWFPSNSKACPISLRRIGQELQFISSDVLLWGWMDCHGATWWRYWIPPLSYATTHPFPNCGKSSWGPSVCKCQPWQVLQQLPLTQMQNGAGPHLTSANKASHACPWFTLGAHPIALNLDSSRACIKKVSKLFIMWPSR